MNAVETGKDLHQTVDQKLRLYTKYVTVVTQKPGKTNICKRSKALKTKIWLRVSTYFWPYSARYAFRA